MNAEALNSFTDALAEEVVAKAGPKLLAYLDARRLEKQPDPLLTVSQTAARLKLGQTTVYQIVESGDLKRAPGIAEIRIRQSVVDAYGTDTKK